LTNIKVSFVGLFDAERDCGEVRHERRFAAFLAACAVLAVAQFAAPVPSAEEKPDDAARRFVEQVNDASMSFFSSGSDQDAREKCRQLLSWAFDVPAMGEYVLGKAWASASEEDRKEFLAAFEDEIIGEYLHRMKGGTTMTFVGTRSPVGGDLLAASRVAVTGKNDQTWIWRMRPQGQVWRIVDVSVDGRSAILSERKTYADVLQANHGDMKPLIAFIRSRADP
jgi:phospholipid transport system substrate-binding protein